MQPDVQPPGSGDDDDRNVVDSDVFAQRRMGDGPEGLLARASAAERAVVSLESRLREIERELGDTASQRDQLAAELQQREYRLRETPKATEPVAEETADPRAQLQREIRSLSERLVHADDRVAELQTDLARARGDVVEAQHALYQQRLRMDAVQRDDTDRDERLRTAAGEIEAMAAALRASQLENERLQSSLEAHRSGLHERLAAVDAALEAVASRLEIESGLRVAAEEALTTQREAHQAQMTQLREELDARTVRVENVQQQLGSLRAEVLALARGSAAGAEAEAATAARLAQLEAELQRLTAHSQHVERERERAATALVAANEQVALRDTELVTAREELDRVARHTEGTESEIDATREALRSAHEAQQNAELRAEGERRTRQELEAALARERAVFSEQVETVDKRVRAELDAQRALFEDQATAVESSIAALREDLTNARTAMASELQKERSRREVAEHSAQAAAPQQAQLERDLADAAARLRRLAEEAGALTEPEPEEPAEHLAIDVAGRAEGLAEVIGESHARPTKALGADPFAELPTRELPEGAPRDWLRPALEELLERDPDRGRRAFLALLPGIAASYGRDAIIDFSIDEVGAHRLKIEGETATLLPWRSGLAQRADLALAGPVSALLPFVCGGAGRKRPKGLEFSGSRRVLRRLLRARRDPVTLGDLQANDVRISLDTALALFAAAMPGELIAGSKLDVGFQSGGDPMVVLQVDGQSAGLREATADEPLDAVVRIPSSQVLALLTGSWSPGDDAPTYRGDPAAAQRVLGWIDQVQRES